MQKEILQELFFSSPLKDSEGRVLPAPQEALLFRKAFRNGWYRTYPRDPHIVPSVDMHPVKEDQREGFVVQKLLVVK